MNRLFWAALAAALLLPAGMASLVEARVLPVIEYGRQVLPVQGRDPDLSERRNGDMVVRFRSGCRMVFNRAGRAIDAQRCSRAQEARAHDVVAAHMRRHRGPGPGGPTLTELRGGRLEVAFRSGCRMIFDRIGRAIDARRCSRAQEARAHDAVAAHMRRHGGRGRGDPRINELRGGRLEVLFRSGCRMTFSRNGRPTGAAHCSHPQERRAQDEVDSYLHRHGRGGPPRREARIIEHRNGSLEVVFNSGCKVRFNRRGLAVDAQHCSRAQEGRARSMAADYHQARRRR